MAVRSRVTSMMQLHKPDDDHFILKLSSKRDYEFYCEEKSKRKSNTTRHTLSQVRLPVIQATKVHLHPILWKSGISASWDLGHSGVRSIQYWLTISHWIAYWGTRVVVAANAVHWIRSSWTSMAIVLWRSLEWWVVWRIFAWGLNGMCLPSWVLRSSKNCLAKTVNERSSSNCKYHNNNNPSPPVRLAHYQVENRSWSPSHYALLSSNHHRHQPTASTTTPSLIVTSWTHRPIEPIGHHHPMWRQLPSALRPRSLLSGRNGSISTLWFSNWNGSSNDK